MKICVVASTYPRSDADTAVPWLRKHVQMLSERGNEVTVFAPAFHGSTDHEIDGVRVVRFRYASANREDLTHDSGAPTKIRKFSYLASSFLYIANGWLILLRLQRRERFDVIHVHWPFPHALFLPGVSLLGKPSVVLNFHGAELLLARKFPFVNPVLRWACRRADSLITNSSFTAGKVKQLTDKHVNVVPYGCPIEAKPAKKNPDQPMLLFVGRLIERKGVEYMLEALPTVLNTVHARVVIVGSGDLKEDLVRKASSLGLKDKVEFQSDISPDVLAEIYRQSTVFCLPAIFDSRGDTEGLGVVLVEAISFGCAVVASNVGGIPDVIVHGRTGLLVPEKNVRELAKSLIDLLTDSHLRDRLTRGALEHVKTEFSWDTVVSKTETIYAKDRRHKPALVTRPEGVSA
ncbi:MAG TPA: glycosyltransferase family 4 protein [Fimbriimonas sp.]|nr:glycosyltransferase family 4 protein [Fimbriimonas sp.]